MALVKQSVPGNFAQGLNTKTDPKQVQFGQMLQLQNTIFQTGGMLQKRNGFAELSTLSYDNATYLSTFNNNLEAVGQYINSYVPGFTPWINKGAVQQMKLSTIPVARSSYNETNPDAITAPNGLTVATYLENSVYTFVILNNATGETVVPPKAIVATGGATVNGPAKVFILGLYFILLFSTVNSGVNSLQYIAIPYNNPTLINTAVTVTTQYTPGTGSSYDAVVSNNSLYIAWNGSDVGGSVRIRSLSSTLVFSSILEFSGRNANSISVFADDTLNTPVIYIAYVDSTPDVDILAVNALLNTVLPPTVLVTSANVVNITGTAQNGIATVFMEYANTYGYDSSISTNLINSITCTQSGSVGSLTLVARSVGLASKAFLYNGNSFVLSAYQSPTQSSYFLLNCASVIRGLPPGTVIAKLAYSNGGGYYTYNLPNANMTSAGVFQSAYLYADLIQAVNKSQGVNAPNGIYSQTGVNLATFDFNAPFVSSEIGDNLHLSGGLLWAYDGAYPTEQNFNLWPDSVEVSTSGSGGSITANQYYYQVIYEWTDLQGNIHRSAPSIPVAITTTGSTSTNTINVPTLRLTYKKNVKISIFRWSATQENYYEITSITNPLINDLTVDYVTFVDTQPDTGATGILGNALIYTTGGVVEDIGPPGTNAMTLYKSRLFLADAEDNNLIWYSKQVIEDTPVEMSDLFTIYVAPTIGASASTGVITALFAMDDKLLIFKKDAIYYMTGDGPDNTGANSDFSDIYFITSTVGCIDQRSLVFMPNGVMFKSDKGIWLLGRDLSTNYIGAPVEGFNSANVVSAINVPATNQVRFTLDSGVTLMYDYYYNQWGTFVNIPALSSTIYQSLHTFIDSFGRVFQETPGTYLDGSSPVLMSFTTGWANLAGLQGFQRAYYFYLLGQYYTPHKLNIQIAYDYDPAIQQTTVITPDNANAYYGEDQLYGDVMPYGGNSAIEQWRVFLSKQKCQSFQISITEIYDPSLGVAAGAGFTLSGLNLVIGGKKGYPTLIPSRSVG